MEEKTFLEDCNTAVFTSKYILNNKPILFVYHYEEDGAWEFIGNEELSEDDYKIISLEEMINIDSSILEILDLPLGYYARRETKESSWFISSIP